MRGTSTSPVHAIFAELPPPVAGTAVSAPTSSRRNMLRVAAGAVGGVAAASLLAPKQAAAANDDPILIGKTDNTATALTTATYTGTTTGSGFMFRAAGGFFFLPPGMTSPPSALAGSGHSGAPTGTRGFTAQPSGYGVAGHNYATTGTGVYGESQNGTAIVGKAVGTGFGVTGTGRSGVTGTSTSSDLTDPLAAGVSGAGRIGVLGIGQKYAFSALIARKASLFLRTTNDFVGVDPKVPPPERTDEHDVGEIDTDSNGDLWYCAVAGTPGTWLKLAGPSTAGSFHPVTPFRAFDSRRPDPSPGVLAPGENRVVSVKDSRLEATGAVVTSDVVPVGAKAVAYNLTATQTQSIGFLAVAPGSATSTETSSINWAQSGNDVANAGIVQVDASRQVKVFCGGLGATHFIVDITGYWL